jgi:TrkA domain protein
MEGMDLEIKESALPGIGQKFCVETRSGERLVIIVHNDERREIFRMSESDPDEVLAVVTLSEEESRAIAAILAGIVYKPKLEETREAVLEDLIIEWIRVEPSFACIGKRIGELDLRQRTGATVIAVVEKDHRKTINPGPDYVFSSGSMLIVVGERIHLNGLKQLLSKGEAKGAE